jgi:hypothetical protein
MVTGFVMAAPTGAHIRRGSSARLLFGLVCAKHVDFFGRKVSPNAADEPITSERCALLAVAAR